MECQTIVAYMFFYATFAICPMNVLSSLLLLDSSSARTAARLAAFSSGKCGSPSLTAAILFRSASCDAQSAYTPPVMNLAID